MKSFSDFGISLPPGRTGEVQTQCPQCSSSRKKKQAACLSVNSEEGVWFCHHCGWSGCLKSGEDRRGDANWWRPKVYRKPEFKPKSPEDKVFDWFKERGISKATVERAGVSYGVAWMPQVEDFRRDDSVPF